jgi:hypothetical protein
VTENLPHQADPIEDRDHTNIEGYVMKARRTFTQLFAALATRLAFAASSSAATVHQTPQLRIADRHCVDKCWASPPMIDPR